jgi:hypothetical protein
MIKNWFGETLYGHFCHSGVYYDKENCRSNELDLLKQSDNLEALDYWRGDVQLDETERTQRTMDINTFFPRLNSKSLSSVIRRKIADSLTDSAILRHESSENDPSDLS